MRERGGLWLWPLLASVRLRGAVREHWKRILVGAFVGWLFAVIGGAIALASLELHQVDLAARPRMSSGSCSCCTASGWVR